MATTTVVSTTGGQGHEDGADRHRHDDTDRGDATVGLGQSGSVVDTVADHRPSFSSCSTAHGIETQEMIPGKRRMPGTPSAVVRPARGEAEFAESTTRHRLLVITRLIGAVKTQVVKSLGGPKP